MELKPKVHVYSDFALFNPAQKTDKCCAKRNKEAAGTMDSLEYSRLRTILFAINSSIGIRRIMARGCVVANDNYRRDITYTNIS